jgi:flagellar assembly protein FliH
MLCSIVDESDVEVGEVPWRRKSERPEAHSHNPQQNVDNHQQNTSASSEELLLLRAKLEEANFLAEKRAKDAWEEGLRSGEATARKNHDEQVRTAVALLAKTAADVSSIRAEIIRHAETDTVRLAIEIARRVLHRELSVDPSALEALIKAAIVRLQTQEIYRVRVHPDLEPLMRTCLEQAGRGSAVEVVSDGAVSKGAASFEISRGTLDASLDTQLREIEYGLADEIRRRA